MTTSPPAQSLRQLRKPLDRLRRRYNRRRYVSPDPLQVLFDFPDVADREIVGMVAAGLSFGNVTQILRSTQRVLDTLGPSPCLEASTQPQLRAAFQGFRHRYVNEHELVAYLWAIKTANERHGSLGALFKSGDVNSHETIVPALTAYIATLRTYSGFGKNYLLPDPNLGSACKRLHMFLRWMVRRDSVDPGGWTGISPARLIVPIDVHMHRICRALGLTQRKQADLKTAFEITKGFKILAPSDPVRYDFALTRLGIRRDTDLDAFLATCRPTASTIP